MSVTFFLKNHSNDVELLNASFNPSEPEDPIYNPRYISENIYPYVNVSNINAARLLKEFELTEELSGILLNKDIDEFVKRINRLQAKYKSMKSIGVVEDHTDYFNRMATHFDKLGRYALALNDDIVWG